MAFADGVLRLVRIGSGFAGAEAAEVEPEEAPTPDFALVDATVAPAVVVPQAVESVDSASGQAAGVESAEGQPDAASILPASPGMADIQAAISMIEAGLAQRIVLAGFPSWPGLLWQAYELAAAANVQILPTVVTPSGRVDIVIERVAQ